MFCFVEDNKIISGNKIQLRNRTEKSTDFQHTSISKKTIQMFFGKFADEGDNTVNDPSIYYVEGTNMLSPSLQPPT
jgi:hypothetical protein